MQPQEQLSLIDAMRFAEDRDDVARQYSRCYEDVLALSSMLLDQLLATQDWLEAIRSLQIPACKPPR